MAAEHDGSLSFDTELDSTGFKKGSEKLLNAIDSLSKKIDALGNAMKTSFQGTSQHIQQTASAAQEAASRTSEAVSQTTTQYEKELARVEKQIAQTEMKLQQFNAEIEAIKAGTDETLRFAETEAQVNRVLEMEQIQINNVNRKYASQLSLLEQLKQQQSDLQLQIEQTRSAQVREAHSFSTAAKSMVSNIRKVASESKKATLQSNSLVRSLLSMKNMLIGRIKKMFITAIFQGVGENLGILRKYYTQYGAAMDRIQNATKRAGGNVAIAIAHLVITAEPFITRLINLLNKALERLNKFFALLRGVKNVTYDDFSGYTDPIEEAAEAQERLNADLYEFDELNRQSENIGEQESSSGGGGGGSPIDDGAAEESNGWLDKIKDNLGSIAKIAAGVAAAFAAWKIGSAILKALGKDALSTKLTLAGLALAIGGATTYALNFWDAWKNGLSNSNINGMLGSAAVAAAGLGIAFKSLKAAGIGLAVGGFGMIVAGAREWIKTGELTNNAFKSIELGIAGLAAGIALITGSWIPLLVGAVAAAGLAIYKNWDTIKAKFQELGASLKEEGARIKETFKNGWAELQQDFANIGAALQSFWQWIVQGVRDFWNELTVLWGEMWAMLTEVWNTIVAGIQAAWQWIITGIQEFIMELQIIGQEMLIFIQELWAGILTALQTAWQWIVTTAQNFVLSLQLLWQNLQLITQQVWSIISNFFVMTWEQMKTWAINAANTIKSTVVSAWNVLQATTTSVFTAVKTFVTTTFNTIKTTMVTAVNSAKATVTATWNALLANCKAVFQGISTTVTTIMTQILGFLRGNISQWYSCGVQLMQGFWNGLRSLMAAIWQSVVEFVQRCVQAVRSALHIGSPSKVFAEIGEFTGEGFIVGLEDTQSAAVKTAENLASAVTEGMSGAVGNVDVTSSGMSTVIDSLREVASIFQTIAQTIRGTGLNMPQISAGTVTPYRTRVEDGSDSGTATDGVATALQAILAELRNLTQNEGGGQSVVRAEVDGDVLFEVVVDRNNRAIQRTGLSPIRV